MTVTGDKTAVYEADAREIEPPPSQRVDPLLYRLVVGILGAVSIIGVGGYVVLAAMLIPIPDGLGQITTASIVGLVALLSTPSKP